MILEITKIIQENPEVLVFLALAIGYLVGKVKIKGFGLGTTASVLLVALALGQFTIQVPGILKNISFALFAFCIGYQVGPQFFGSLRKEGLNYLWISLVVALAGLATVVLLGKALHFDKGTTAGLFAGAMTQSAVIGTAEGAVDHLVISAANKTALNNNIAVAYAITYIFGTVGVILLFKILPRFMRVNIKDEAKRLEEKTRGLSTLSESPEIFSWSQHLRLRAYKAVNPQIAGKNVAEIEKLFTTKVSVQKVKRGDDLLDAPIDMVIKAGDVLVMAAKTSGAIIPASTIIGPEVDISGVAEVIGEVLDVCILNPRFTGKAIGELAKEYPATGHNLFIRKITRQGRELPIALDTIINKCDVIQIMGAKDNVEQVAKTLGYAERPTSATDLVMVGIGCVLGTLLGAIVVPLAGIPLTLSAAGGVLIAGLVFGWLRSIHPTFGQIPEAGQWIFTDFGLNLFIACVGLSAGKQAIAALQTNGIAIFLAGIALAFIPIIAGLVFGKYALRMNPILLLGALTGARVIPPALTALEEDAQSSTLVLGFAAPFAFANVFLTIMGSIIINIM